jgi:hypothetical protein
MAQPTDNLKAAKAILDQPAEDIGSAEIEQALAHAVVAAADNIAKLLHLLQHGTVTVITNP